VEALAAAVAVDQVVRLAVLQAAAGVEVGAQE
jgi:hypothetical protein